MIQYALNQRSPAEGKGKGQKLLAQGNTLGIMAVNKTPCKGKSLLFRGKMKFFEKKVKKDAEKFGGMKKKHYLCTRF